MKLYCLILLGISVVYAVPTTDVSFANDLFQAIAKDKRTENIVFSPASIEACLGLAYLGAEGDTASEIKQHAHFSGNTKEEVSQKFQKLYDVSKRDIKLDIANRIYVDKQYELSSKFNELANKYFQSTAKSLEFAKPAEAADDINAWVAQKTDNKIQQLVSSDELDSDTAAILINAIYFKADWVKEFDSNYTTKKDFSVSGTRKVPVDMMFQKESFRVADLPDLNALAIQLPYYYSKLSMLIILPNAIDGLSNLEAKLQTVDLRQINENFKTNDVNLYLPKFKIEFEVSLVPVLKSLGMTSMFSKADFGSMLSNKRPVSVSDAKHKAFIEVNEYGTEAAAVSAFHMMPLSGRLPSKTVIDFVADHPFFFAITDTEYVYFAGHVVDF